MVLVAVVAEGFDGVGGDGRGWQLSAAGGEDGAIVVLGGAGRGREAKFVGSEVPFLPVLSLLGRWWYTGTLGFGAIAVSYGGGAMGFFRVVR